jgi:glycosyltransferase involved in cell wall biosynthesis
LEAINKAGGFGLSTSCVLSVATTAHNEVGNVDSFLARTVSALRGLGVESEVIYVDDGSTDGTSQAVSAAIPLYPDIPIHLVRHPLCKGITAAMMQTASIARGEWICFLPADLESLPDVDIPILFQAKEDGVDVVVGLRQGRMDGKVLASALYNLLNRFLFGVRLRDANWIKLVRRVTLSGIHLRSDWHRYLVPILAANGCCIKEVETPWNRRVYGSSKFGLRRFPGSLADLITIKFLLTYGRRPFLFFGWTSAVAILISCVALLVALCVDVIAMKTWVSFLVLSGVSLVVGLMSLGMGLLGELRLGVHDQE